MKAIAVRILMLLGAVVCSCGESETSDLCPADGRFEAVAGGSVCVFEGQEAPSAECPDSHPYSYALEQGGVLCASNDEIRFFGT